MDLMGADSARRSGSPPCEFLFTPAPGGQPNAKAARARFWWKSAIFPIRIQRNSKSRLQNSEPQGRHRGRRLESGVTFRECVLCRRDLAGSTQLVALHRFLVFLVPNHKRRLQRANARRWADLPLLMRPEGARETVPSTGELVGGARRRSLAALRFRILTALF